MTHRFLRGWFRGQELTSAHSRFQKCLYPRNTVLHPRRCTQNGDYLRFKLLLLVKMLSLREMKSLMLLGLRLTSQISYRRMSKFDLWLSRGASGPDHMRSTLLRKLAPASVSISSLLLARLDSQAGRNHLNLRSTLRFDKSSRDCVYRQPLRLLSWCLFQRRPSRRRELPLQCMVYRAGQVSHCPTCRRHLFQLSPQGCG